MNKQTNTATLIPESLDVNATIEQVENALKNDKAASPALVAAVQMMLLLVKLLFGRLSLNSRNSSKPPSQDPNRPKEERKKSTNKQGGQKGREGKTLKPVDDPDEIIQVPVNRDSLPPGQYHDVGYDRRQVFDIQISRWVKEYRAQILEDAQGNRFTADFPADVDRAAKYGASVKANAVYMSVYQLIPYDRVQQHFDEMFGISLSTGSLFNFNKLAYHMLADFETLAKLELINGGLIHADETGINVGGKRIWLHNASNGEWTWFEPHAKRGKEAMDEIGILPQFAGTLCHDHWKPYYRYTQVFHSLCNAHHLRELTRAYEQDGQEWANGMYERLIEINDAVNDAGGQLDNDTALQWRKKYQSLLDKAERECPPPPPPQTGKKKKGRVARSKARNLLERLRDFEDDVLRFMDNPAVPFTNNQGERDIRMAKVQQKISGCFRSMEGAKVFCRVRSYISTCQKNNVGVGQALECLFAGKWPDFIQEKLNNIPPAE